MAYHYEPDNIRHVNSNRIVGTLCVANHAFWKSTMESLK